MKFKDYYKILELNPTASKQDIKNSYRKLALKYHPDRNFGDKSSEAMFQEIQEAYETLLDESKRVNYDFQYQRYYSSHNVKDEAPAKELKSPRNKYKAIIGVLVLIFLFAIEYSDFFLESPDGSYKESGRANVAPKSNSTNSSNIIVSDTNSLLFNSPKASESNQESFKDWRATSYSSGNTPNCYDFTPRYSRSLDNKLKVSVGNNTNVVIKVVNIQNNKCIRYVYIQSGETYEIKNIPEGKYYLKIAFGKDWREKKVSNRCIGKFVSNPIYRKGDETLDFNLIYNGIQKEGDKAYRSYQIPSYSLRLDVLTSNFLDQFKSTEILENEFQE